jgi:hypothetical protein
MLDGIRWIGLDVRAHKSTLAIFEQGSGELGTRRVAARVWRNGCRRIAG